MPNGILRGVAMHDLDLIERHAELADDELGEGGFVALAVAVGAGEDGDAAGGMDADFRDLVQAGAGAERADHRRRRDAAGFDVGGDADAAQLAARLGRRSAGFETVPIGVFQGDLQGRLIVAAVVLQRDRRLVGEGIGGDEIFPPQLDPVDTGVMRDDIDQRSSRKVASGRPAPR